jgi:hypothetical protein
MWSGVPPIFSIILFFLLLFCVGLLEGLQIALFAAANLHLTRDYPHDTNVDPHLENIPSPLASATARRALSEEELSTVVSTLPSSPPPLPRPQSMTVPSVAMKNCNLVFRGKNFASFVVGRQICVTFLTVPPRILSSAHFSLSLLTLPPPIAPSPSLSQFIIARISVIDSTHEDFSDGYTTFSVPSGLQRFINTGIIGAYVTTILGSLIFRVIASKYPLPFLSSPFVSPLIHLCLLLEATGVMHCAHLIAKGLCKFLKLQSDQTYQRERVVALRAEADVTEV